MTPGLENLASSEACPGVKILCFVQCDYSCQTLKSKDELPFFWPFYRWAVYRVMMRGASFILATPFPCKQHILYLELQESLF